MKVDWCSRHRSATSARYRASPVPLTAAGRRMIVTVSTPGTRAPWRWAPAYGNTWRIANDADGTWAGVMSSLEADAPLWRYARPGAWNDPDILQIGSTQLSDTEARAHFSLWSMLAAPLLAGYDLSLGVRRVHRHARERAGDRGRPGPGRLPGAGAWAWAPASRPGCGRSPGGSWAVLFLNRNGGCATAVRARRPDPARAGGGAILGARPVGAHASRPGRRAGQPVRPRAPRGGDVAVTPVAESARLARTSEPRGRDVVARGGALHPDRRRRGGLPQRRGGLARRPPPQPWLRTARLPGGAALDRARSLRPPPGLLRGRADCDRRRVQALLQLPA